MADSGGAYTGNGKYRAEMCQQVLKHYINGESDAEVAVALNISKSMLYRWIKEKPEFAAAIDCGKTLSEKWWQQLGRAGCSGKVKVNARIYIANMKNRFGWQENPFLEEDDDKTLFTVSAALKALKEKHAKEY